MKRPSDTSFISPMIQAERSSLRLWSLMCQLKRRARFPNRGNEGREVGAPSVGAALLDYMRASQHLGALRNDDPLWTRYDLAGEPWAALSPHFFVENLKRYDQVRDRRDPLASTAPFIRAHGHRTQRQPGRAAG